MSVLASIFISAVVGLSAVIAGYNYIPLSFLEYFSLPSPPKFGATITTIQSTDTLRDSRSTINTNFTNLNTDKIEVSTTSVGNITTLSNLVSIGTITTGVWNGTVIGVAYNGTGTTSPTTNQVMLGNGASGFRVIGFGSSGQFLQSQGADTAPAWATSSIDQAAAYNWTGLHTFFASTTFSGGIQASVGIATSSSLGSMIIEGATGTPPIYIGDKGSSSPVFVVNNTASTTFTTNWTLYNQAVVYASSTAQTGAGNAVAFDTELFDTCNCHDNSTNNSRLTAAVDGYYQVNAMAINENDVAQAATRVIRKNGSQELVAAGDSFCNCGTEESQSLSTLVFLNQGDYLELVTNSNGILKAYMTMHLIGK